MKDIQSPAFIKQLRDELNIAGPVSLRMDEVVTPVVAIAQRQFPDTPSMAAGTIRAGASAGNRADCYLRNPEGSGVLCVVRDLLLVPTSGTCEVEARVINDVTTGSAVQTIQWTDSRKPLGPLVGNKGGPACELAYTHNVATSILYYNWINYPSSSGYNPTYPMPFGWVITPGFAFNVRQQEVNMAFTMSIRWTEQPMPVNA
jgi:hypothetical protein